MKKIRKIYLDLIREDITSKKRVEKGKNIEVESIDRGMQSISGLIQSKRRKRSYMVSIFPRIGEFNCSCEDYQTRGKMCKHIIAVIENLDIEEKRNTLKKILIASK